MMVDIDEAEATEVQSQNDSSDSLIDFSKATKDLAIGTLAIYQQPLEEVKKDVNELICKQQILLSQLQNENVKLQNVLQDVDLKEMVTTIKSYQGKLVNVKKEMVTIHDRTLKLKKRALRLQQIKQKEALSKEQQREQELRKEQELIGKPTMFQ